MKGKGVEKRRREKLARSVEFVINEPEKQIPGGALRESTLVSGEKYPVIAKRRRLNSILLSHCPSTDIKGLFEPEDEDLLQRITQETVTCGVNPVIRRKAIWALRFYPTVSSINVLADLAESGEDEYIRSYALQSLGAIGLSLALPVFIKGLRDKSDIVNNAAKIAIIDTVDRIGTNAFASALRHERNMKVKETINTLLKTKRIVEKKTRKEIKVREVKPD